ncbi:galactokinase [Mucilaginibacter sp. JRF]|uniref:galactokinase n=1 Tax=Mucilaginibacter sp. JRF TaxID=2780088 RepID=UPI001880224F|nr:galactokinase [Mucilaginibacter sp. JRF]MBE9583437.1 galactokinase [Mucilaginibacter sp. JRF]
MTVTDIFQQIFEAEPLVVQSPGRINLLGEHTDYNEGFVLPAAVNKYATVAISANNTGDIVMHSVQFDKTVTVPLAEIAPQTENSWTNYVLGVTDGLIHGGKKVSGFNIAVDGDIPIGAGMSSSAGISCAVGFALNELFGLGLTREQLARTAQWAEHNYAGVACGIMDQFASLFGKANHLIQLDCRSIEYKYVPIEMEGYALVLFNTNVKHNLASTEYNQRRKQCEKGVALVKEKYPQVNSLRDVTMDMLRELVEPVDVSTFTRCKYVVEENDRLLTGCDDLRNGDLVAFGKKMFATHHGLSQEYSVSCPELDFLVDAVRDNADVLGARMMGGGFGGCTINLIKEEAIDNIAKDLAPKYEAAMGKPLTTYVVLTGDGTSIVSKPVVAA